MNNSEVQILLEKYLDRTITAEEYDQLLAAAQEESEKEWESAVVPVIEGTREDRQLNLEEWQPTITFILQQEQKDVAPVYEIKSRKNWIPYPTSPMLRWASAAAAVLLIIAGAYLWLKPQKEIPSVTQTNPVPVQNDVAPGGNRATLTLADGSKIVLDSAANGAIARQGGSTITKSGDQVVYSQASAVSRLPSPVSRLPSPVAYNTMTTPRGGQYKLTLPDGSQVWLNAESSITYPTAFNGNERNVSITGEVYFEVAKDRGKRFIVSVHTSPVSRLPSADERSELQIEVLGTQFNVNAYNDEPTQNITLIEGSVRLTSPVSRLPSPEKTVLTTLTLRPGQQGQLTERGLFLASNPDVEQAVAWKNGLFNFNGADLKTVLRQLERWYDIDVQYESMVKERRFKGELQRNLTLMQILKILKVMDVQFRLENRTLFVK